MGHDVVVAWIGLAGASVRIPIDRENDVLGELRSGAAKLAGRAAYCTATRDFAIHRWNGDVPVLPGMEQVGVRKGDVFRIVRMMRHGHLGLTSDLDGDSIVQVAMSPCDDRIVDIRWTPEPTHADPQADADSKFDSVVGGQEDLFP